MHNDPNLPLRTLASKLLAKAALDTFPDIQLGYTCIEPPLFAYEFVLKQPQHPDMIPLLEERMRGLIKQKPEIRETEMMGKVAAEYFKHVGQPHKAYEAEQFGSELVPLIAIDGFKDLCFEGPILKKTDGMVFKLIQCKAKNSELPLVRVTGYVSYDNDDIKAFMKKYKEVSKWDPIILGSELGLFDHYEPLEPTMLVTLPKGLAVCRKIINWWEKELQQDGYKFFITPKEEDPSEFAAWLFWREKDSTPARYAEFTGFQPFQDRSFTFCTWDQLEKELNYSLQFLQKCLNMLGIESHWVFADKVPKKGLTRGWAKAAQMFHETLKRSGMQYNVVPETGMVGPRLQGVFPDPLGRPWPGPSIELHCSLSDTLEFGEEEFKNLVMIRCSLFDSLERYVTLLLQKNKGVLPNWLNP